MVAPGGILRVMNGQLDSWWSLNKINVAGPASGVHNASRGGSAVAESYDL